jgi:hypothetical protein
MLGQVLWSTLTLKTALPSRADPFQPCPTRRTLLLFSLPVPRANIIIWLSLLP